MVRLFVGGFPLEITEMKWAQLIAPHGNISTIKIFRDQQSGKCKGYAFVEVLTEHDAAQIAAALNSEEMEGRELSARQAVEKPAQPVAQPAFRRPINTSYIKKNPPSFDAPLPKRPRRPLS